MSNYGIWQDHIDAAKDAGLPGTAELIAIAIDSTRRLKKENEALREIALALSDKNWTHEHDEAVEALKIINGVAT